MLNSLNKSPIVAILVVFMCLSYSYSAFAQSDIQNINSVKKAAIELETANMIPEAVQIPPPPAIALPNQAQIIDAPATPPLAWRSKALALANEYPIKEGATVWVLPVKYIEGQGILRQCIDRINLELVAQYPESGQFLLSIPEANNKAQIIVITQPVSDNKTLFKMRIYGSGRLTDAKRASALPDTMKSLVENKGLWQ